MKATHIYITQPDGSLTPATVTSTGLTTLLASPGQPPIAPGRAGFFQGDISEDGIAGYSVTVSDFTPEVAEPHGLLHRSYSVTVSDFTPEEDATYRLAFEHSGERADLGPTAPGEARTVSARAGGTFLVIARNDFGETAQSA